eukprot:jgi/Tetstr1/426417/TSEL_016725.t1
MGSPKEGAEPSGSADYYGVLGLKSGATDQDVRRAYRSLALSQHPDKCNNEDAENAFKVINEAYDVLSNPMKRSAYDLNGEEGLHELHVDETTAAAHAAAISSSTESTDLREKAARTTEISPGEAQDMFERLFGARKLRAMFAGACQQEEGSYMDATCRPQSTFARSCREPQADEPVERPLAVTLEELAVGTMKRFQVLRPDGSAEVLHLEIKAGWTDGTRIVFPGRGGYGKGAGDRQTLRDLAFIIQTMDHPIYRREQHNLVINLELPLVTALCGGHLTIPQFGSRPAMQVPITPGIQVGSVMMIPGHGMPNPNGAPGDLKTAL